MTARTTPQPPGTPTWLDFWTDDADRTAQFFRDLMGYDIPQGKPEWGNYTTARVDGRHAFGIGPAMPNRGPVAALFFATDDMDARVAKAVELGAKVLLPATKVDANGTFATLIDPAGVLFSLFEADQMVGYDAVDERGFPCWQDCLTTDVEGSKEFMSGLFGFTYTELPHGAFLAKLGDDAHFTVGHVPTDPHWVSYLMVDDVDASAARVTELGGSTTKGPEDIPEGRFVHCTTPDGAPFGLFTSRDAG